MNFTQIGIIPSLLYMTDLFLHSSLATALYEKANTENTDAGDSTDGLKDTLDDKKSALDDALSNQSDAADDLKDAIIEYNRANAEKARLQALKDASDTKLADLLAKKNAAAAALTGKRDDDGETAFKSEVSDWLGTNPVGVESSHATLDSLTVAELELFAPSAEAHDYYQLYIANEIAYADWDAESDKNADLASDLSSASSELASATTALDSAKSAKESADTAVETAQTAYKNAWDAWRAATESSNGTQSKYDEIEAQYNAAVSEQAAATAAYNAAYVNGNRIKTPDSQLLKININLEDANVILDGTVPTANNKWKLLPQSIANNEAIFYYTGILDGGTTSTRLIKSVELDSSVTQDMYKSFDFDLNVGLDSVQISYADDQVTLTTDAPNTIGLSNPNTDTPKAIADIKTPTSLDTIVDWN